MRNPFLIGTAIYLRPLEPADAAVFTPMLNDPEVTRHLLIHRPMSLRQEEAYLANLGGEDGVHLGVIRTAGDLLLGACGLREFDWRNRQASFGIFLGARAEWGKGHGTEATRLLVGYGFRTLNLNRIWLHVFANNPRAIRAYEKVGFKVEGTLRQSEFREGRYWDTVAMAILRDEWAGG